MSIFCTKFDIALFYILIIWVIEDLKYVNTEESNLSKNSNQSTIYRPNQIQKQWERPEIYNIQNDFTIKYDEKKPKIITKLKNMRVLRDEQAIFICVTDGNPSPVIRWFVNEQYQLPKRYTVVEISPKKSLLRLNPVKISDDNIRITCFAKSQLGVSNSYAQLMVYKGKEDTPSGFPTLLSKSSVIVNEKNTRVLLECKVKGNPKPEILWLKDSIPVDFDNPRIQFLKNGNLEINKTQEDDEGAYECMATNKYGTIVSNVIRLMIRENIEETYQLIMKNVSYFAPQFIYVSDDQIVAPGSSVTLKCRALGNPIPEVFWKCGQTILQSHSSNLTLQKTEANVILSDLSESLKCTCVAKNSKEPIFRTISITIQELSIAPTNIRISHVGPTSCNISWNQKAVREDQLKYQIFIMKTSDFQNGKNDKTGLVVNMKKSDYEFVINKSVDNLLPFTNYTVWLELYPQQIDSIKSNILNFTTLELPPYTPPRNVELSAISNGALVVTWISPEIPNGIITIYNIYYTQYRQTSLSLWEKYTVKATTNSESKFHTSILSHLLNNVTYYISISAQNSAGPGPVSEPQAILVRAGVVQGPKNFRAIAKSSTEIELFWDPIISKTQISVKWYYLRYMPKSAPDLLLDKKIEYSPNIKTILIDNLSPNTTYEFQLSAITESANGMSSTVECTTSVKVIEDPIKVYTKVINSTSIQVFWQTNPDRNRQIDFFRIQCHRYFPDRKNQMKDFKEFYLKRSLISSDSQNTTMRHTFTQLNPDTEYQIYLNAIFRQRQGSIFKSEPVKTWPKKLPKPQDLHLRLSCQFDNPCVEIKWKEDIKNKKWIRGYQLKYYPLFESNDIKMKIIERNVTDTKFETSYLDHLQGIRYEFRVAGFSDYEIGEETISQIDILEGTPSVFPSGFKLKPTSNLNPTLVIFTWDKVLQHLLNGRFRQYEVWCFIISQGNGTSTFYTTKTESLTISNLKEDSNYACRVRVWIQKTSGSWSDPIYFKTRDAHFPPPESIRFIRLSHSTAQITWKWNPNFLLYYSHFIIYYTNEKHISNKTFWFIESTRSIFTKVILRSLNATVSYAIRVSSVSNRGIEGPLSEIVKESSLSSSSWPAKFISELSCAPVSSTTIQLRWFISFEKQFLTHFRVNFTGVTKFQSGNGVVSITREEEEQSNLVSKMGDGKEQSVLFANHKTYYTHQILNLKPNTQYTINIEPIFSADSNKIGVFNQTICTTFRELPGYLETLILSKINKTTNLIELLLPKPNTENGTIDDYYINIKIIKEKTKRKRSVNFMDEKSMEELKLNSSYDRTESSNPYIAISLKHDEIFPLTKPLKHVHKIIIGEGKNNGRFKNWQLNTKFNYQFQLIACIGLKELQSLKFRCRASSWTNQINIIHTIPLSGKTTNLSVDNNIPYKSTRKGPSTFTTTTVVVILGIVILAILSMSIFLFIKRRKLSKSKLGAVYVTHSNRISNEKSICMEHLLKEPLVDSSVRISTSGSLRFKNPGNAYLEINNIQLSSTPDLLVRSSVPQPLSSLVQFHGQHFTSKYSEYAPIPVEVLPEHVAMLKENDGRLFNKEYESIEPGQQFTWNCSNMDINRPKNRYANVIAYDHSRVILQPLCEQKSTNFNESTIVLGSDYINANFISGYLNPKAYIATQGPLAESIGDFWRMMWEQNSSVIVMMTRLEERDRTKCDQYWPLGGKGSIATYSYINVTIVDIIELAYYTIRKFHIQKLNDSGLREVFQFQFTAWPDHGVPNHPAPLLMFLRRVHSEISRNCGPIVVHCSAGVGRTGAFIVIDYMLERLRYENTVDIYNYVTKIRSQRNYMVQTEDQYIFIYETLLEAVQCGNTEVPVSELARHIEKLNQIEISHKTADGIQMTGLQMEFENLVLSSEGFLQGIKLNANNHSHCSTPSTTHGNIVTNYQPLTYETATLMVNQMKNRIIQILPPDFSRVNICPIRGVEGSDYINASWIDGYKSRKAYIAAQSPLSDTCEDFWRTLWEHNSSIIVMLTQLKENNRERCFQYWPCKRSSRYQFFIVDPVAEYNMTTYVIREFKLTDTRDSQSRVIRQFQFTDWQESESIPHSTQVFLDLINQVHKTKVQLGQDGPITVHCSAGSGRTGIFLALSNIIERMKNESVIDLFQTVKLLRWQRPALLQTEDQYQFCYLAALEYLKIFEQMRFDL